MERRYRLMRKGKEDANNEGREKNLQFALDELKKAGFVVKEGKKGPKDGSYSGIVGNLGNPLIINSGPLKKPKEVKPTHYSRKENKESKQKLDQALQQLKDAGFEVRKGRTAPKNGVYSGIVGKLDGPLVINLKR